jgi:hypothetical protein
MADTRKLSGIDLLLLENLSLIEENNSLRNSLVEYRIMEKKMGLQKHLMEKYSIDIEKFDFTVDGKEQILTIVPRPEKPNASVPPTV